MSEKRDFDFCPRCGALMQNGVCQSCGRGAQRAPQTSDTYQGQNLTPPPVGMQGGPGPGMPGGVSGGPGTNPTYIYARPAKTKNHTAVIVIVVTLIVFLFLGILFALIFSFAGSTRDNMRSGRSDRDYYDDDFGGYDDDYDYGYYEPDEDDPYYREIVDCTRTDLDYAIQWAVESMDPDDSDDECTYYTTYPQLEMEDAPWLDAVNEAIRQTAVTYRSTYKEYDGGISTFGYVTLMDEEKISIVFKHNFYKKNVTEVRLEACTFRIETGGLVAPEEMTEIDLDLAMRFQSQDKIQNEGVDYVQDHTAEELLADLQNPDSAVFFYTPVGLEVGINYPEGWVTVTMKEQAL